MNTPHPLVPQGSVLEQQSKGRSRVRLALFIVVAAHVVFLGPLLIQGCKPESKPKDTATNASYLPSLDPSSLVDIASSSNAPTTPVYVPTAPTNTGVLPLANLMDIPTAPVSTVAGTTTTHKIAAGDTLGALARHYHVSLNELLAANPSINPTRLKISDTIVIPAPVTTTTGAANTTSLLTTTGDTTSYKVKAGDTLSKIASAYGTSVKAIQSVNGLRTTSIQAGKTLKIPSRASAPAPASEAGAAASIR